MQDLSSAFDTTLFDWFGQLSGIAIFSAAALGIEVSNHSCFGLVLSLLFFFSFDQFIFCVLLFSLLNYYFFIIYIFYANDKQLYLFAKCVFVSCFTLFYCLLLKMCYINTS